MGPVISNSRRCLTLLVGCSTIFVFAASVALLYSEGVNVGGEHNRSQSTLRPLSCGDTLSSLRRPIQLTLIPAKAEPMSAEDREFEAAAAAAAVRQTPDAGCNRALSDLVRRNQSGISTSDAFGLSPACLHLLLDREVTFVSEATRLQLMSNSLGPWNKTHCFRRAILESEKPPIRQRLALVKRAFDRAGVPLILDGGSLVGSYRHHGFVPWDDDFDFRINQADCKAAHDIFSDLAKRHPKMFRFSYRPDSTHWKFYILDLRLKMAEVADFLLCLDIFFYHDYGPKNSQMNLTDRWFQSPRKLFFPLTFRPFEGLWFPAPGDTYGYLKMYYGDVQDKCLYHCYSNLDSEKYCWVNGRQSTSCSNMHNWYPFVRRVFIGDRGASLEFMLLGKYLLQTVFLTG